MSTVVDVAREAEVSVATVSRVLNNSFMVTQEKCERVRAAIEKLDYKINTKTKEGKRSNSKILLVITSVLLEDLFANLNDTATEHGYNILYYYCNNTSFSDSLKDIIKILNNNMIAGIISLDIINYDTGLKQILNQYPVVQIGNSSLNLVENYIVSSDEYKTAYDIVSHLIQTGKKRVAIITVKTNANFMLFEIDREKGYKHALIDNNVPYDPSLTFYSDFTIDGGSDATKKILELENKADAIFCICDTLAVGCIYRLKQSGVSIPDEISVAGIDNSEIGEFFEPSITTADQSIKEIGIEAINMLISLINGNLSRSRKVIIDHEIIIRDSSKQKK